MLTIKLPNGNTFDLKSFSSSQLKTFKTCPKRWELTKIYRVPTLDSFAFIRGRIFHEIMEELHLYSIDHGGQKQDLPVLKAHAEMELRDRMKPEFLLQRKLTKAEMKLKRAELIENRLRDLIEVMQQVIEKVYNEMNYTVLAVERSLPTEWHGMAFNAIVDLLVERDGEKILIDYKTKGTNDHKVDKMQYAIYLKCLADNAITDVKKVEQWDIIFTAEPKVERVEIPLYTLKSEIEIINDDLQTAFRMMEAGLFIRNEQHSTCSPYMCPVWEYCRNKKKLSEDLLNADSDNYHPEVSGLGAIS